MYFEVIKSSESFVSFVTSIIFPQRDIREKDIKVGTDTQSECMV